MQGLTLPSYLEYAGRQDIDMSNLSLIVPTTEQKS